MWGCLNREIYVGQTRLLDARYLRGGAHCGNVVVLILSANTGAENEMLKIDCDSCVYGTGLKQSKRHNECYVPTLGLAALSTLDGSVKVEHIFTFLQKRKLLNGNFKTSLFIA